METLASPFLRLNHRRRQAALAPPARNNDVMETLASPFLRLNHRPRDADFVCAETTGTSIYGSRARTGVPAGSSHSPRTTFCRSSALNPTTRAIIIPRTDAAAYNWGRLGLIGFSGN